MAVLSKIRQRSVFLIAIIALALFAFVLADVIKNGGFTTQKSQQVVATVNGEDINQQEFANKVEMQASRYGGAVSTTRAMNATWEQEVRRIVLEEQYDELGITIEKDRLNTILREALQDDPTFQNEDGTFSEGKMREYIASLKSGQAGYERWVAYEQSLAQNEKQNIYFNLVKAGLGATYTEGQLAYEMENNTRDIQFVQIPYTSIPDDQVEVSKEDIQEYLNAHKNEYQTEATRNIRFVKFDEKATKTDEEVVQGEVSKLLDNRVEYNAAVKVNDTVIGLKNTTDAGDFVNEFSDLRFDDRYLFKNELPAGVRDTLFAMEEGDIYGPYKDNGFYKISKTIAVRQLPDSVKASHILLTYAGLQNAGAETRSKAAAKKLADSLASVIKSDADKLAELAPEYSADGSSRENGGELDYTTKGRFVKPFSDFVFEGEEGEVGVVESNYGYHIIRIEDQKNPQRAVKIATVAKEIQPSQQTINNTFTNTTKFEMAVGANKENFGSIAKDSNYVVRPVNNIKVLDENIPGQGSQRDIVRWAFEEDTQIGDVKRFQVDGGYLVVQLTDKAKKGLMTVDGASAQVTPLVRNEKKAALIKDKITSTDLNQIATSNSVSVQSATAINLKNPTLAGAGTEPKVVGAAFSLDEGEQSEPINGSRGVYVVKVLKVNPAREMDSYASFALQQTATKRAAVNTQLVQALKDAAEIDDRRSKFY